MNITPILQSALETLRAHEMGIFKVERPQARFPCYLARELSAERPIDAKQLNIPEDLIHDPRAIGITLHTVQSLYNKIDLKN